MNLKRTIIELADPPHSFKELFDTVLEQSFWTSIVYLTVGVFGEWLRRLGMPVGIKIQRFLDGLFLLTIDLTNAENSCLRIVYASGLSPFWNRCLIAGVTVILIFILSVALGSLFTALFLWLEKRLLTDDGDVSTKDFRQDAPLQTLDDKRRFK